MAWELLPVDYTDAVWAGLKRYNQINNEDGSVSFQDITAYTGKEKSFFGAKDANRMNEALNTIMSMVENGTDLYTAFQNYFAEQKTLFEQEADSKATEFDNYTDNLEQEYKASMAAFESQQQQIYNAWFQAMKDQLSKDAAGNLQNQCTELDERLTLLEQMTMQNDFSAPLATDDEAITLIVDDLDYALYDAYLRAKSGSDWKPQVQRYEMAYLLDLSKMQRELKEHTYEFQPCSSFPLNERGKTRFITGEQIRDRIAKHSLCDEVLTPAIKDHLIYDNGASQKGKGIDFTRRRLEAHLHRFFRENQSNDGYILLMDFSKYYDNIRHDKLMELFEKYVDDDTALWFLEKIVDNEKVDVSYMSDEEYESAMDDVFNSLEHEKVDKSLLTGKKFLRKHLNIGDQVAQDAGIAYPIPIDNYIKIVKGVKFYGRYMDDSYVIHKDKEFLKGLLTEIVEIAQDLGITVNIRKTRICKLSEMWRFLQIQYSLTDTGRVIHKIHPKRLTGMRRKAKKLALILSEKDFDDWFRSWFNGHCHYMSKLQRSNMLDLCKKLKEEHYYGKTDFS